MRKKSNLHKTVNSAVSTTIERFSKLKPTDRFAVLEEMGEDDILRSDLIKGIFD
jgi:hypothetical protein